MATLGNAQLQQARSYVRNYLDTGDITKPAEKDPQKITTVEQFVSAYNTMFDQVVSAHGGKTGTGASARTAHIHTGTGGVLLALLEQTESPLKEQLATTINNNGASAGYVLINGTQAPIAKSPCTTHDVKDFALRRGLWAGQQ